MADITKIAELLKGSIIRCKEIDGTIIVIIHKGGKSIGTRIPAHPIKPRTWENTKEIT